MNGSSAPATCSRSRRSCWPSAAAGARVQTGRRAARSSGGFSFRNIAREAGLTAVTVFGGTQTNKYLLETTGCRRRRPRLRCGWLARHLPRQRLRARGLSALAARRRNHLYRNKRDGTFEDVTAKAGLTQSGWGQGACAGDYDNDGFDDLFVTYWGQNRLYRNRGNGTFEDVTVAAGLATAKTPLGRRVCLSRLRSRRPPRPLRGQLHRLRSRLGARARVGPVPLQGHSRRVRTAGASGREERVVPQHGQGHVRGCFRARRHHDARRAPTASASARSISTTTAGSICTWPTTRIQARCI